MRNEPGLWPVEYGATECSIFDESGMEAVQLQYEAAAAEMLWNWTGRVFGTSQLVVRPSRHERGWRPSSFEGRGPVFKFTGFGNGGVPWGATSSPQGVLVGSGWVGGWLPLLANGSYNDVYCGSCGLQNCQCEPSKINSITLPGPTVSVEEVLIDGSVLDPGAYRLEQNRWLVRQDGSPWPYTQNLDVSPSEVGTWQVTYTQGIQVPMAGQMAAGVLACELAKAAYNSDDCALPQRMQQISREGISIGIVEAIKKPQGLLPMDTGIWAIDAWVNAVGMVRPYAAVRSVDHPGTTLWKY